MSSLSAESRKKSVGDRSFFASGVMALQEIAGRMVTTSSAFVLKIIRLALAGLGRAGSARLAS